MKKLCRRYRHHLTLLTLLYSPFALTADEELQVLSLSQPDSSQAVPLHPPVASAADPDLYTVNFNNISIIELIRFTSKISGLNFVFEEPDLQFSVTVISEEPVSKQSLITVLSQVLRMRGLTLLEQGSNVLITSSKKINQIPRIVSADLSSTPVNQAALVTRVFRIRNASVAAIADIIRPMVSDTALIEISLETRQLIVTDVTTNVDQIATLLSSLDAPHTPLEVESYVIKYVPSITLIPLVEQILTPFKENNPLVLVPQSSTNTIYIVSTPYLIERAIGLLEDLDVLPASSLINNGNNTSTKSSFFVYHPVNRSGEELAEELTSLAKSLSDAGLDDPDFLAVLKSMKWTPSTNSLVFTGDPTSIAKIQAMLQTLDVVSPTSASAHAKGFFLYKLQHVSCDATIKQLHNLADKLPASLPQNQHLISAIDQLQCIPASNSLLISGTAGAIAEIKAMIAEFDTAEQAVTLNGDANFLIYKPKFLSADEITAALKTLANATSVHDPKLLEAVESAHYVEQTNSLIFTGSQPSLDRIQQLLVTIDNKATSDTIENIEDVTFLIYRAQSISAQALLTSLKNFASQLHQSNISNKALITSISTAKWIADNNSLLFTGNAETLRQVEALIRKFDNGPAVASPEEEQTATSRQAGSFVLYTPRYLSGQELISILQDFMQNLQQSGVSNAPLYDAINNLKWISKTSSLLISGEPSAIAEVQQLLTRFDIPGQETVVPTIESIDNTSFLVYKLQYHPGNDIQQALKQVAISLDKNHSSPTELVDAINSLQWIQVTNSILCTGHQDVLIRLKELIQNLDVPLRQVFIEVLVIETTLNNQQNFGLMWGGQVQYMNKTVLNSGNFPLTTNQGSFVPNNTVFPQNLQGINGSSTPGNSSIPFTTGFDLGVIGDIIMHKGKSFISLGSLINAIQQDTDSTVVINPKIIAQDNRQSTLFVGQNVPYTGAIVTNTQANTTSTANIEYRDVGVSLTITPILGEGDIVTMDIVQDLSEVTNAASSTSTTQLTGIQTSHTHMETRVHVPNNHFVALSGMIDDVKTHFKTGIPCLGGLPYIGVLFSESDRAVTKNNIIVFIRPQIINTYQDYKRLTEHQEWTFKDSARLPSLKEAFDEGIDLVKLPENE